MNYITIQGERTKVLVITAFRNSENQSTRPWNIKKFEYDSF